VHVSNDDKDKKCGPDTCLSIVQIESQLLESSDLI
jgi:hypothetical protein